MRDTHGGGNQQGRDLRGDPGAPRTAGADTRDKSFCLKDWAAPVPDQTDKC